MAATSTSKSARQQYPPLKIEIEHSLAARLRPEAARRDMPTARLVRELLSTIVEDGLTTAILGDGDGA